MRDLELSSKAPSIGKRIYSGFVDLIFALLLAVAFDFAIISPIVKNTTNYYEIQEQYIAKNKDYMNIQDEYGIYVYDSSSVRDLNDDIPDSVVDDFLKDERVIELREEIPLLQRQLLNKDYLIIGVSYLCGTFVMALFADVLLGRGVSIGRKLAHYKLVNKDGEKIKVDKLILYGFVKWLIFYVLGPVTLTLVPIIFFAKAYYNEESLSPLEKWFDFKFFMLEKYVGD